MGIGVLHGNILDLPAQINSIFELPKRVALSDCTVEPCYTYWQYPPTHIYSVTTTARPGQLPKPTAIGKALTVAALNFILSSDVKPARVASAECPPASSAFAAFLSDRLGFACPMS